MSNSINMQTDFEYNDEVISDILRPIIKKIIDLCLQIELNIHLKKNSTKNRRNGYTKKNVRLSFGSFLLNTPRDRNGSFDPILIKKNQTNIASENKDKKILYMLSSDITRSCIRSYIDEIYHQDSHLVDKITDLITKENNYLQSRELSSSYENIWIYSINCANRNNTMDNLKCHAILGISSEKNKELLGIYSDKYEGKEFWQDVFIDFKNRGIKHVSVACLDSVAGTYEAARSVFPGVESKKISLATSL